MPSKRFSVALTRAKAVVSYAPQTSVRHPARNVFHYRSSSEENRKETKNVGGSLGLLVRVELYVVSFHAGMTNVGYNKSMQNLQT